MQINLGIGDSGPSEDDLQAMQTALVRYVAVQIYILDSDLAGFTCTVHLALNSTMPADLYQALVPYVEAVQDSKAQGQPDSKWLHRLRSVG